VKKVYISVINDLVSDQRVSRLVDLLIDRGAEVTLVGRSLRKSPAMGDVAFKYKRFRMLFTSGALFYASFNFRLLLFLLFKSRPNLLISNDLDTLPANFIVSKVKRCDLIYDSHEYFTEVPELIKRKRVRKIWISIEKLFLPHVGNAITVSPSIARAYNNIYGIRFSVVRNLPTRKKPLIEKMIRDKYPGKQIIIYQGALNVGRGLELMIQTMLHLEESVLLIVGDGDIVDNLAQMINDLELNNRVFMPGRLNPKDLFPITCSSDIGISLEEDLGLSYRYALPNKMFDYVQARIPVLCSDLPEMKGIVEKYDIGISTSERDPEKLAGILKEMMEDRKSGKWKLELEKAAQELCWENESEVYVEILSRLGV
jgi:glycosyltransferase involved in cell wall biosynthesis